MARLGGVSRAIGFATAVCVAGELTGCTGYLPAQGPTLQAVVDSSAKPVPGFALVEICDPVLDALSHWGPPSFYGTFGDHRPPVEQTIGIGDSVQVTVWEAAAGGLFSTPVTSTNQPGARSAVIPEQTVTQDGAITMPYAGRINVIGRTPPQVEKIIVQRLTGKAIEPQALVTVTHDFSNTVTVVGDALKQGDRIPLNVRGDRILTVIAESGGIITPVPQTYIELSRSGRTVRLPMQSLVSNPRENVYARPGDVVTVVHYVSTVTAVGATGNNAPLPFDDVTMNLEEAVAKSGGLIDERADPAGVFVLRYEPADIARLLPGIPPNLLDGALVPVAYHINMRDPAAFFAARRFAMRDKDILFVSNSPSTELTKVLQMVDLVTSPVYSAGSVATSGAALAK
jgi:polysaccharide biosynthesis/export protein